jgi:FkbM family methyltransferase
MHINYFDFGLHNGDEIVMFSESINSLKDKSLSVYGFEAHPDLCNRAKDRYKHASNIKIFNKAVSFQKGKTRLYIAKKNKMEGNSIFISKNNVDAENYVDVETFKFSDWVKESISNFKKSINVVRFNIEGAEIYLIKDIIESGIRDYIHLFLGSSGGEDILKCTEIAHLHGEYMNMLEENKIKVYQFCKASPNNVSNEKIQQLILNAKQ